MAKREKSDSGPSKPSQEWLLVFSDLLTLLMTLFVLLISMSSMDSKRLKNVFGFFPGAVAALQSGKGHAGSAQSRWNPRNARGQLVFAKSKQLKGEQSDPPVKRKLATVLGLSEQLVRALRRARSAREGATGLHPLDERRLDELKTARPIHIQQGSDRMELHLHLGLLFAPGMPAVRPASSKLLHSVRSLISKRRLVRRVYVPTAERGLSVQTFSPWDLAAWRAASVARALRSASGAVVSVGVKDPNDDKSGYAAVIFGPPVPPDDRSSPGRPEVDPREGDPDWGAPTSSDKARGKSNG